MNGPLSDGVYAMLQTTHIHDILVFIGNDKNNIFYIYPKEQTNDKPLYIGELPCYIEDIPDLDVETFRDMVKKILPDHYKDIN